MLRVYSGVRDFFRRRVDSPTPRPDLPPRPFAYPIRCYANRALIAAAICSTLTACGDDNSSVPGSAIEAGASGDPDSEPEASDHKGDASLEEDDGSYPAGDAGQFEADFGDSDTGEAPPTPTEQGSDTTKMDFCPNLNPVSILHSNPNGQFALATNPEARMLGLIANSLDSPNLEYDPENPLIDHTTLYRDLLTLSQRSLNALKILDSVLRKIVADERENPSQSLKHVATRIDDALKSLGESSETRATISWLFDEFWTAYRRTHGLGTMIVRPQQLLETSGGRKYLIDDLISILPDRLGPPTTAQVELCTVVHEIHPNWGRQDYCRRYRVTNTSRGETELAIRLANNNQTPTHDAALVHGSRIDFRLVPRGDGFTLTVSCYDNTQDYGAVSYVVTGHRDVERNLTPETGQWQNNTPGFPPDLDPEKVMEIFHLLYEGNEKLDLLLSILYNLDALSRKMPPKQGEAGDTPPTRELMAHNGNNYNVGSNRRDAARTREPITIINSPHHDFCPKARLNTGNDACLLSSDMTRFAEGTPLRED